MDAETKQFDEIRDRVTQSWPKVSPERADEIADFVMMEIDRANRWIPVGERLPAVNDYGNSELVLVVMAGAVYDGKIYNDAPKVTMGQLNQNRWVTSSGGYAGFPIITHWQPLPTLPSEAKS